MCEQTGLAFGIVRKVKEKEKEREREREMKKETVGLTKKGLGLWRLQEEG